MGQVLPRSATTTEAIRRAIQNSQESMRVLARRHGINPKTVAKRKRRESTADRRTGPSVPRSTVLTVEQEAIIVAFRKHTLLPLRPGQAERRAHDYLRHGATRLFTTLDTRTGKVISHLHRRHRPLEFRKFLDTIEASVPAKLDVHLVMDNYATHKTAAIQRWMVRPPTLPRPLHTYLGKRVQSGRAL